MNVGSYNCCRPCKLEFQKVHSLSSLLKLIGEESRLKILCVLSEGTHCVCEVIENVDLSQSLISHHLADLKEAGLVEKEMKGRRAYYKLTFKGNQIIKLLNSLNIDEKPNN